MASFSMSLSHDFGESVLRGGFYEVLLCKVRLNYIV